MKKIFLSVLAMAMLSGAVYANKGKKRSAKKAKSQPCSMAKCAATGCDPSTCTTMPGCCH